MLTATKRFSFAAAHLLEGYDGPCAKLHGHTWDLEISVSRPNFYSRHDESEFVVDFRRLNRIVQDAVVTRLDHAFLNEVLRTSWPSAELIVNWIRKVLSPCLFAADLRLVHIRLYESATAYIEWRPDNAESE